MPANPVSRRSFITRLTATGAIATTQITPLGSFANTSLDITNEYFSPDRIIHIVCTQNLSSSEQEQIRASAKNIELHMVNDASSSPYIEEAEVILGGVGNDTLRRAKKLHWVQIWSAGVENMSKELIAHPCTLTNMQKVLAPVIAESAIGLLLSLTRGLTQVSIPAIREHKWTPAPHNIVLDALYGKTIGIVGMGGIGSETARRLHYGFNMRVLATDAKPLPRPEYVAELKDPTWLMEMIPQVDVLMSAAPLTKETRSMFNEEVFHKLKSTAYFINVTRGGLVDQPALINALKENRIRGAGLDVCMPEPLPPDNPLWSCPNIVITPHNSALADARFPRMMELVCDNVHRYSMGLPLRNVVDKEKGY